MDEIKNLPFVLQLLQKSFLNRPWCFLSGGTDGIDGPTDAAGGLVDNGTLSRIKNKNKSIYEFLENNDSYEALKMAEDLDFDWSYRNKCC